MFKWLNAQGVESDSGFIVQSKSRFAMEYREGDKVMTIEVEDGLSEQGEYFLYVEPDAFERWDGDPPYTVLPSTKQDEVLMNFTEALRFMDIGIRVEPRPSPPDYC